MEFHCESTHKDLVSIFGLYVMTSCFSSYFGNYRVKTVSMGRNITSTFVPGPFQIWKTLSSVNPASIRAIVPKSAILSRLSARHSLTRELLSKRKINCIFLLKTFFLGLFFSFPPKFSLFGVIFAPSYDAFFERSLTTDD